MYNAQLTALKNSSTVTQARRVGRWITSGTFAVDASNYVLILAGTMSHPVMLLATLWVTVCATAPEWILAAQPVSGVLTSFAFVSFALLPEVITYKAIVKCLKLWRLTFRKHDTSSQGETIPVTRGQCVTRWTWAVLYSIPTLVFLTMTLLTLLPFTMSHGQVSAIAGNTLGIRAVAGWFYVLIGLIEKEMGKSEANDSGEMWYTRVVPVTRQPEYTTSHQIDATLPHLPLPSAHDQPASEETPSIVTPSQSIETHNESIISTLETEHDVITDTFVAATVIEETHGTVKTREKREKIDIKKASVNKSEWIRQAYYNHPTASITDIQALAVAEGFTVSRGLVSSARV